LVDQESMGADQEEDHGLTGEGPVVVASVHR
jgi:hypothetical protein